jgi:hypothetical protein
MPLKFMPLHCHRNSSISFTDTTSNFQSLGCHSCQWLSSSVSLTWGAHNLKGYLLLFSVTQLPLFQWQHGPTYDPTSNYLQSAAPFLPTPPLIYLTGLQSRANRAAQLTRLSRSEPCRGRLAAASACVVGRHLASGVVRREGHRARPVDAACSDLVL